MPDGRVRIELVDAERPTDVGIPAYEPLKRRLSLLDVCGRLGIHDLNIDFRLLSGLFTQLSSIFGSERRASRLATRSSRSVFQASISSAHNNPDRRQPPPKSSVLAGFSSASIMGSLLSRSHSRMSKN